MLLLQRGAALHPSLYELWRTREAPTLHLIHNLLDTLLECCYEPIAFLEPRMDTNRREWPISSIEFVFIRVHSRFLGTLIYEADELAYLEKQARG